jgi:chromosome segregation ATPase
LIKEQADCKETCVKLASMTQQQQHTHQKLMKANKHIESLETKLSYMEEECQIAQDQLLSQFDAPAPKPDENSDCDTEKPECANPDNQ